MLRRVLVSSTCSGFTPAPDRSFRIVVLRRSCFPWRVLGPPSHVRFSPPCTRLTGADFMYLSAAVVPSRPLFASLPLFFCLFVAIVTAYEILIYCKELGLCTCMSPLATRLSQIFVLYSDRDIDYHLSRLFHDMIDGQADRGRTGQQTPRFSSFSIHFLRDRFVHLSVAIGTKDATSRYTLKLVRTGSICERHSLVVLIGIECMGACFEGGLWLRRSVSSFALTHAARHRHGFVNGWNVDRMKRARTF